MKYWKQGFYDEPVQGSIEIEDEYYYLLLDGQSSGKEIKENEGYPVVVEHEYSIIELQELKFSEIKAYDKSEAVNTFTLFGKPMWLDKSTRVGLMNSVTIEKQVGKTNTVLWFNAMNHTFPITDALAMLNAIELYALDCYNVTQSHLAAVKELDTEEAIHSYDFRNGYPEKKNF